MPHGGKLLVDQLAAHGVSRVFEVPGESFLAALDGLYDTPAIRTVLRESGYAVFPVGKEVSGREILQRLLRVAGIGYEERREYLLTGGPNAGYEVRVTGAFPALSGPPGGPGRKVVLIRRKIHSATRVLLRDMGVEIVEW